MGISLIYMTAANREQASALARSLVESRLAACANLMDGVTSTYWWEGKVVEEQEVVIIAKTRADLVEALIAQVKAEHSYACPCVVAVPITTGNADFLAWVAAETLKKA